jgi:hypothetical protein
MDKNALNQFKRLLDDKTFRRDIKFEREIINGFKGSKNSIPDKIFYDEKNLSNIYEFIHELIYKRKLPNSFDVLIEGYLKDEKFVKTFDFYDNDQIIGAKLIWPRKKHEYWVEMQIFPEATKKDIQRLVDNNWNLMRARFKNLAPEFLRKKTRLLTKRSRDEQIYKLYKKGVLKYGGEIDEEKADKLLSDDHEGKSWLWRFKQVGIDLPGESARKKVIWRMKKVLE